MAFLLLFLFQTAKDEKTIFFSSLDVSKADSASYLSEVSLVVFLHNGRLIKLIKLIKEQRNLFFCVTMNSQKIYLNRWNSQNNGSILLAITSLLVHRN